MGGQVVEAVGIAASTQVIGACRGFSTGKAPMGRAIRLPSPSEPTRTTQSKPSRTTSTRRSVLLSSSSSKGCAERNSGNRGVHDIASEAGWHVDAQAAAQVFRSLREHRLELVQIGQQILAALVKDEAVLGRLHAARSAVEEARAASSCCTAAETVALGRPRLSAARVKPAMSATRTKIRMASSWSTFGLLFALGEQRNHHLPVYPSIASQ